MLNKTHERPSDVMHIYRPNMNEAVIQAQLSAMSTKLADAFSTGGATLTVQEPTLSQMAALIVTFPNLTLDFSEVSRMVATFREDLRINQREIEIDMASRSIAFKIETYAPSAYVNQIVYDASTLAA